MSGAEYFDETWVPDDNEVGRMAWHGWLIEGINAGQVRRDAEARATSLWNRYQGFKDKENESTPLVGHEAFSEARETLKSAILDTFPEIHAMEPDDAAYIFADLTKTVLRAAGVVTVFDNADNEGDDHV